LSSSVGRGARGRGHDTKRGSARERGYNTRWEKARKTYLMRNPLCVMCQREGRVNPATVVDHIFPHKGDQQLFWDTDNWQGLCKPHHDRDKQREERRSFRPVGDDGWPI
jgi:5-methylcytosine-specific restriction protein A